jgi:hypothetical protein
VKTLLLLFTSILSTFALAEVSVPLKKEFFPKDNNRKMGFVLYKNQAELERYFDCFKVGQHRLNPHQKKVIEVVSKHYNLPSPLMSCTLFIESRFNTEAISPVGAHGLAQFMPETLLTIVSINTPPTKAQLEGCKKTKLSQSENIYCSALVEQQRYVALWTSLQSKLKAEKLLKDKFQFNPFSSTDSIAMSGMYLNYILTTIDQRSGYAQGKQGNERLISEYKLTMAAYNRGLGKIASMIQRQKENMGVVDLDKIVDEIRINKETSEYMDAIERCLVKNDFRQPISASPEKTIACSMPK